MVNKVAYKCPSLCQISSNSAKWWTTKALHCCTLQYFGTQCGSFGRFVIFSLRATILINLNLSSLMSALMYSKAPSINFCHLRHLVTTCLQDMCCRTSFICLKAWPTDWQKQ